MGESITPGELSEKTQKGALVVDVRSPREHSAGAIPGSINIPFLSPNFLENFSKLKQGGEVVVYCQTGNRSKAAQDFLLGSGYKNIINLLGGFVEWKRTTSGN